MYSLQHCLRALLIKSIPFAIATDRWHIFQFVRSSSSSKANTHGTGEVGGGGVGCQNVGNSFAPLPTNTLSLQKGELHHYCHGNNCDGRCKIIELNAPQIINK